MTRSRSARQDGGPDRDASLMRPGGFDGKKLPELPFVFVGIAAVIIVVGVILELEIQDIGGKLALGVVGMVLLGFVRGSVGRRR